MVASDLSRLTNQALTEFIFKGERAGLLALADKLQDEQPDHWEEDARNIRAAVQGGAAVRLFAWTAPTSHRPDHNGAAETLRGATELARAEQWFRDNEGDDLYPDTGDLRIEWVEDTDWEPDDAPGAAWGCVLSEAIASEYGPQRRRVLQSLWGITFAGDGYPSGQAYARVVVAELCLEELASREKK